VRGVLQFLLASVFSFRSIWGMDQQLASFTKSVFPCLIKLLAKALSQPSNPTPNWPAVST
jgi:hypothetical protein